MIKLTILDKYIGRQVLMSILFTLLVLTALRTLFSLLDEAGKIGEGSYQMANALYYVILLAPSRIYEFFPMAVLIGGLVALGVMAGQNELTVMRAAGIKTGRIVFSALKATLVLMVMVVVIGEWIAPHLMQSGQAERAKALSDHKISQSKSGVWARSQNDILHIERVQNDQSLIGITLFRLNENLSIQDKIVADSAIFINGAWQFKQVKIESFGEQQIALSELETWDWRGQVNPEHIAVLSLEPEMLSLRGLHEYQQYLENNHLDSGRFRLEFWRKIAQPITLAIMMVLASSFIFGPMRLVSMGARLMTGIVVGFGFHIVNSFFGPISLVYNLPPFLGAVLPLALFSGIAFVLMKRAK